MKKWEGFTREFLDQVKGYVFLVALLGVFRVFMILWFHKNMRAETGLHDILLTFTHGFRFDSKISALVLIIPFLANCALGPLGKFSAISWIRKTLMLIFVPFIILSMVATVPYFSEYDSQFNFFMFEILYDDQIAVLKTVVQEYGFVQNLFLTILLSYLALKILFHIHEWNYKKGLRILADVRPLTVRILVVLLMFVGMFGAIRGSFKDRPAMRKWAEITSDEFLNKMVMNPPINLDYAFRDFKSINSMKVGLDLYLGDTEIKDAAEAYFGKQDDQTGPFFLSDYLSRKVENGTISAPAHIFLIILESYDMWPLLPEYRSLGIAEGLKELGRKGVLFSRFLPAGKSTMSSLSTILTGVPYMGKNISRIAAESGPYSTSIPKIFEPFGYTTRLFYGGFSSWQNIGNMFRGQGFDEIYSSPHMEKHERDGVWGVQDGALFDFIRTKIPVQSKTFNIILTTTNHPPFNVDVKKEGFSLENIPADILDSFDGSMDLNQLGHIWYMDRELKEFVDSVESVVPNSLFIITGDHYGRRFINSKPSEYIKSTVPLVIYGPGYMEARSGWNQTPGSHTDIVPTILELAAPEGYQYSSFGRSLFSNDKTDGIGYRAYIDSVDILRIGNMRAPDRYNYFMGLAWWFIFRGDSLGEIIESRK